MVHGGVVHHNRVHDLIRQDSSLPAKRVQRLVESLHNCALQPIPVGGVFPGKVNPGDHILPVRDLGVADSQAASQFAIRQTN
jgi:hypothetical protein